MKYRKHLGLWLLITLVMALGIGAVGAVTIARSSADEEAQTEVSVDAEAAEDADSIDTDGDSAESTTANPSGYLSNQRKHDIDLDVLGETMGAYTSESGEWKLEILEDYGDDGPYLTVSNAETGKDGFEGRIMYFKANPDDTIDGNLVIVEIDKDSYERMPDGWSTESDGDYAILDVNKTNSGVRLGYRGTEIEFVK